MLQRVQNVIDGGGRGAVWLRLACLAGAFGVGSIGYYHLLFEIYPWWQCLLELGAGSLLLGIALRDTPWPPESTPRRVLRGLAGAIVVAAAGTGTYYWTQEHRDLSMTAAGIVAVLAFGLARWVPFRPADVAALTGASDTPAGHTRPRRHWLLGLAVVGVLLGVAACIVNLRQFHLTAFCLWLGSLAAFVAGVRGAAETPPAARPGPWVTEGGPQLALRTEALTVFLILLLGLALRLPLLGDFPALVDADEGRLGRYGERIWREGFPDAFGMGWNGFAHLSFMGHYLGAQLFGHSNANLRLAAVAAGMLSLLPVFYWVRRWWGNVIGVLALLMLAITHEHVYWSRVAFNNIQAVLVASLMLVTFARVLQTRRLADWVWFGYAAGLGVHTYHAAKLFPVLLAAAALLLAIGIRGFLSRYLRGALVGAVGFILTCGPLLATIYYRWGEFYRNTTNRWDVYVMMEAYERGDFRGVHNWLYTHVAGTLMSFVNVPWQLGTFDPFLCVPFIIGAGWMLWRWRDPRHLVVLAWTVGIMVLGSMLTSYPPNKPRLVGLLPVIVVIPAVVAGRIRALVVRAFPTRGDLVVVPLLIVWLSAALYHNWWTEFVYRASLNRGDIMTSLCRVIDTTPTPAGLYMAGEDRPADPKAAAIDCMIASNQDRVIVNLPDDARIVPLPPQHRGHAVLMLSRGQREMAQLIRHYYPDARHDIVYSQENNLSIQTFTLTPRQIEQYRGLRAAYQAPGRTWSPSGGVDILQPPDDAEFPLTATWRGQVYVSPPGSYAFRGLGGEVRVHGYATDGVQPFALAAGWHTIEFTATFADPTDVVALEWLPAWSETWTAIPRNFLHPHPETHGLLGRYFDRVIDVPIPAPIAAEPGHTQLDSVLSFDWFAEIGDPPPPLFAMRGTTMEWSGSVELPEGPVQTLRLEATSPTQVFVNDELVLAVAGPPEGTAPEATEATLPGLSGRARILVRTVREVEDRRSSWKLRLLWRDGGGDWTPFVRYHPPWQAAPAGE